MGGLGEVSGAVSGGYAICWCVAAQERRVIELQMTTRVSLASAAAAASVGVHFPFTRRGDGGGLCRRGAQQRTWALLISPLIHIPPELGKATPACGGGRHY